MRVWLEQLDIDATPWTDAPAPRTYVYRSPMIGRSVVHEWMVDRMLDATSFAVLVTGARGAGKTRLAVEVGRTLVANRANATGVIK